MGLDDGLNGQWLEAGVYDGRNDKRLSLRREALQLWMLESQR